MAGDVATGLVGHWAFNETSGTTAADLAGGDDPGTLANGPAWTAAGAIRGALSFDGVNDEVSVAHRTAIGGGTGNFTLAAWVKTTAATGAVVFKGTLTGDHYLLEVESGKAKFQFNPGGGPFAALGTSLVNDGNWHLLVGVRTGVQSAAIYVDGALQTTLNATGSFTSIDTTTPLYFGRANSGLFFTGAIDDARFYSRALAAADVSTLYTLGSHPVSIDDVYFLPGGQTSNVAASGVLANDIAADDAALTAAIVAPPAHGSVSLAADGSFVYTPNTGYLGADSFTYRASDGRVDPSGATVALTVYDPTQWATIAARVLATASSGSSSAPSQVSGLLAKMNVDGSFSDLSYVANTSAGASGMNTHAARLKTLAQAYQYNNAGNTSYHSATLKQRIVDGWTYFSDTAPGVLSLPNWYDQKIGVPNNTWPGLVLMQSELSSTLMSNLLHKYFDSPLVWDTTDLSEKNGGANLTDRVRASIAVAVLRNAPGAIVDYAAAVSRDLNYGGMQATGLMPDDSFHQHTTFPTGATYQGGVSAGRAVQWYPGSYGLVYASDLGDLLPWLHGTFLALSSADESQAVGYVLDGEQWLFRGKAIEATSTGRAISRYGDVILNVGNNLSGTATRLQAIGTRTSELQQLVARLASGATAANHLDGNKAFWTSDELTQQRQGYLASVRMISQRTLRPETLTIPGSTDAEGATNYFLADGVTTVYQDGTEYGTTSGQEIFPVWNWSRLPGTTLEQLTQAQVMSLSTANVGNGGTGTFVGEVSNGRYGAAAMDYGRSQTSVTAKKSWFFFDEGFVALGAAINAPTATNPVYTTLNQVLQDGNVTIKLADGQQQTFGLGTTLSVTDPQWMLHDGMGYALLGSSGTVTAQVQAQTGTWDDLGNATGSVTKNVFSAWVDHGTAPQNATYAYAVLPGQTAASLDAYWATSPLTVLSNTAALQAVRNAGAGLTEAAFYQAGSLAISAGLTIAVDRPCLVMLRELPANGFEISVSDPTQSQSQVQVDVSRRLSGGGAQWMPASGLTRWTATLPSGVQNINAGQSVVQSFADANQAPTAAFTSSPASPSEGSSVAFDGGASADADQPTGTPLVFTWDFGDGSAPVSAAGASTLNHVYADNGSYSARLTVTDSLGATAQVSHTVVVANVTPTVALGGPFTIYTGGTASINATATDPGGSSDPITFTWDLDGDGVFGETGTAAARGDEVGATVSFSAAGLTSSGTYSVSVRADDGDGGIGTASTQVVVVAPPTITSIVVNSGLGGGNQRSSVMNVLVTFSTVVTADPGAFALLKLGGAGTAVATAISAQGGTGTNNGNAFLVTFVAATTNVEANGSLKDGNYQLTVAASLVHEGLLSLALDGNGDGQAGDNRVFGAVASDKFFRLYGDSDGDRDVDTLDYARFRNSYGKFLGDAAYAWYFNFDGDSDVDALDYARFRGRLGSTLAF